MGEMNGLRSEGVGRKGRPKKTRSELIEIHCQIQQLNKENAVDRIIINGKKLIKVINWIIHTKMNK